MFIFAFLFTLLTDFSPIFVVLIAIISGILYGKFAEKKGGDNK